MDKWTKCRFGAHNRDVGTAIIISRDEWLIEQVLGAAAAVGTAVERVREPELLRQRWRSASAVFVGVDAAPWCAGLGLPTRRNTHIVGRDAVEASAWSVPLEASLILLPDQVGFVSAVLDDGLAANGAVLRLIGASGGLGVSTLAVALGQLASRDGPAAVVELASCGGGLDVLAGVERRPGWRWAELSGAVGHLGDLGSQLPHLDALAVVAHGRTGAEPTQEAATAVVRSLVRTHPLVVLDAGRGDSVVAEHWSQTRTVLVVGADVRGVLSARAMLAQRGAHDVELVVRRGPGRALPTAEVTSALGLEATAEIGHLAGVAKAAVEGVPPLASGRSRLARQCRAILNGGQP